MNKQISQHIIRFLLLSILQILVFSFLPVYTFALGFVYIFFILFLPLDWPKYLQLILAFGIGLTVDFFTATYGIHAIIAPIILILRHPILKIILPKYNDEEWANLNLFKRDFLESATYLFIMSFIFCTLFFPLNFFSVSLFPELLYYILGSTIFTFIILLLYRYIFALGAVGKN